MSADLAGSTPDWGPLQRAIAGEIAVPGSPAYDRLPQPFNARYHELQPQAIVLCASPQDVAETILFLAGHRIESAVRSGGHCFAGHSSTRGVVVDVTGIGSVSVSGGVARVGAGARLGAVYDALQAPGLAIPAGTCPPVGIAGLALGGGLGILGRTYGVTSDHLAGAQIVLADGRILECDEHHHDDLFWALRGAGAGNFGVVTSFEFRTVPAPEATNVHLSWPFSLAVPVIDAWQEWAPRGPDELAASLKVTTTGDVEQAPSVDVYAAVLGSDADATALAADFVARVGSDPARASHRHMSFPETRRFWAQLGAIEDLVAEIPEPAVTEPRQVFAKSEFFRRPLPTDAIAALVETFSRGRVAGESRELDFMPWGGAYNRVRPDRLVRVKARYDPANVFRFHQSLPTG